MNQITVCGMLTSAPMYADDHGKEMIKVHLRIQRTDISKDEHLMVIAHDPDIIRQVLNDDLQPGDLFFTDDAYVETTNYVQEENWTCSHCEHTVYDHHQAEILNVVFRSYQFVRDCSNDGSQLGINHATLLGTINTNPVELSSTTAKGLNAERAKYKLAVTSGWGKHEQTHYPFIVNFRKDAQQTMQNLRKGDKVLIEGNVQERRFLKLKRDMKCPECDWVSSPRIYMVVREIIVRNCEYIDVKHIKEMKAKAKREG